MMSTDVTTFHSTEADDPSRLPGAGWYIGFIHGDQITTDDAIGPFATQIEAREAMIAGAWLS